MNKRYVIVGAGLAGSTCALLLRRAGCDVVLLERGDAKAKSKLCGGLMTPRSIALAESLFGAERVDGLFGRDFSNMLCVTQKHETMLNGIRMRSLHRKDLDDLVLNIYLDEGGQLRDRCTLKDIDASRKLVFGHDSQGTPFELHYDCLIAADGALSAVRKAIFGALPRAALCLEADVAANPVQPLTMLYSSDLKGYCWYIPRGEGAGAKANVGCVSYGGGASLDDELKGFAASMGVTYEKRRGAFLPTGGDICLRDGDVFFIGDASGLVCPPTGEGIYYALASARLLAQALTSSASFEKLMEPHVRDVSTQFKRRDLFFSARFINMSLGAAEHTPYGTERAIKFALKHFAGFGD